MSSVESHLRANGAVLPASALHRAGFDRRAVRAEVSGGRILRIRNGWFALPDAHPDLLRAVRVGGTATATTVARMHGLWTHDDGKLHVRVRHSTGRLFSPADRSVPLDREAHAVCVHYSTRGGLDTARDPLTVALAEMFACSDDDSVVASIDSALERGALQPGHLESIRERMPRTRRALIDRVAFDTQSGLETRVRLLLQARRIRFRAQAYIDGVGNVDFLVGERLVIEVDGREFHTGSAFEQDRRRDLELVMRGHLVLRLSYRQVMHDWDRSRAAILALVARGEHRWSGRGPYTPELPPSALAPSGGSRADADA